MTNYSPSLRESFRSTARELLGGATKIVDDHEHRGIEATAETTERLASIYARARALSARAEGKQPDDAPRVNILTRTIRALAIARGNRTVAADFAAREGDVETQMMVRAATDAATTGVASWAGVFTPTLLGELIEYTRPKSALFTLAPRPFAFGRAGALVYPRHASATPSGFVGEGSALPVKDWAFDGVELRLYKAGAIAVATGELLRRGDQFSETFLNDALSDDLALGVDTVFLSDSPATPDSPAGIFHVSNADVPIPDTAGADALAAATDIANLLAGGANMTRPTLLINPVSAARVSRLTGASDYALLTGVVNGRAMNASVLFTPNIAATTVALIDADGLLVTSEGFELEVSTNAALHMDTTPDHDLQGASPVRSLFQTDTAAVRTILQVGWRSKRLSAVQRVENVSW